jgi:hypothetical protein
MLLCCYSMSESSQRRKGFKGSKGLKDEGKRGGGEGGGVGGGEGRGEVGRVRATGGLLP